MAEVFSLLMTKENNFLSHLSRDNFKRFRKRFTGMILATDVIRHEVDQSLLNELLENQNVCKGVNAKNLIDKTSGETEFKSQ